MPSIAELHKKYFLSEQDIKIYGDIIIDDFTAGLKPVSKPIAIILGGQPAAGKSELTTAALNLTSKSNQFFKCKNLQCYKSFDLTTFWQGVQGVKRWTFAWGFDPFIQGSTPPTTFRNAWTPENHSQTVLSIYDMPTYY